MSAATENPAEGLVMSHSQAVDALRKAQDALWATALTPEQQQALVDLMNAAQDLNTCYWEQVHANAGSGT